MAPTFPIVPDTRWFCPLLNREIAEGYCLDIQYQRLGYFKPDVLTEAQQESGKSTDEVSAVCENCSNQPLT